MRTRFPEGSALADTPFIVFLLSALLPWFAFQEGLNRAASAILNRREMVRKVHFPLIVFPLAAATALLLRCKRVATCCFLAIFALWRGGLSLNALGAVAVLLGLQLVVTAGLGLLLAAFTVYLRDTSQVLGLLLAVIFYAPILYPMTLRVPVELRSDRFNPFTAFAEGYHSSIGWCLAEPLYWWG